MSRTILILGGSFAGLTIAHKLLKHTIPQERDIKVILVSKNSHFYFNLASVRAIIPGQLKEELYMTPIKTGFAQYSKENFDFIVGSAEAVDFEAKNVRVKTSTGDRTIQYSQLVLCTGSRTSGNMPWKANGTHEEIVQDLKRTSESVRDAKHIVVAGGGATGLEAAGELAFEYKDKKIILVTAGAKLLDGDLLAGDAEKELKKLGVEIRYNTRTTSTKLVPNGQTEIILDNGSTITTDLYLPTTGLIPNSEFLPKEVLRAGGFVDVDENYRVLNTADVWAAGDLVWKPRGSSFLSTLQGTGVAKNIAAALKGQNLTKVKLLPIDIMTCAVGRSRGVMRLGQVRVFSILAYYGKAKSLGLPMMKGILDGSSA